MSMMTVDDYLALPFTTVTARATTTHGNTCYVAIHPELPGCRGQGSTPEAAKADLEQASRLYIEDLVECGDPVPVPALPQPLPKEEPELGRFHADVASTGVDPSVRFEDISAELAAA